MKLIAALLLAFPLFAATITQTSAGNWSDGATWVGGVAPGIGDIAVCTAALTVDVTTTVGTSPADATTMVFDGNNASCSLTFAANATLNLRGNGRIKANTITGAAGASLIFDSTVSSFDGYVLQFGVAASDNPKLVYAGSAGNFFTIDSIGTGKGRLTRAASAFAQLEASYLKINNLGSASNTAMDWSATTSGKVTCANCEFFMADNGSAAGGRWTATVAASADFDMRNSKFRYGTAHASEAARITFTAATTGVRRFWQNTQPITAWGGTAPGPLNFAGDLTGLSVRDNVWGRMGVSTMTGAGAWAEWRNNFYSQRGIAASYPLSVAHPASTLLDNVFYLEGSSAQSLNALSPACTTAFTGTFTIDGNLYQAAVLTEDGDYISNAATSIPAGSVAVLDIERNIALPNARGRVSGSVNSHDNALVKRLIDNNTLMTDANGSTGVAAIYTGATFWGYPNLIDSARSNLVWCNRSTGTTGQAQVARQATTTVPETGAVTGGASTSTVINLASLTPIASLPTTANASLASSQAIITFTSGALNGESRTITANTGSQITVGVAFSGAPTAGDTVRIVVPDILDAAEVGWNALFNVEDGTLYDQNGANGATYKGYHNFSQTTRATIGQSDVNLGSGTYDGTNGPRFVDATRNVETAWGRLFGQADGATWVVSTVYSGCSPSNNVFASRSTATWYSSALITYRCIADHTASATNRPGDGTDGTWQQFWEPATLEYLRAQSLAGTPQVANLHAWIKAGFTPRGPALGGLSHTGGSIGAVTPTIIHSVSQ